MTTREIIDKLPELVLTRVKAYRNDYTGCTSIRLQAEIRDRMAGYVLGLRDAGLITEYERRAIFTYMTVAPAKR